MQTFMPDKDIKNKILHIPEKSTFLVFNTCLPLIYKLFEGIFVEHSLVSSEEDCQVVFERLISVKCFVI